MFDLKALAECQLTRDLCAWSKSGEWPEGMVCIPNGPETCSLRHKDGAELLVFTGSTPVQEGSCKCITALAEANGMATSSCKGPSEKKPEPVEDLAGANANSYDFEKSHKEAIQMMKVFVANLKKEKDSKKKFEDFSAAFNERFGQPQKLKEEDRTQRIAERLDTQERIEFVKNYLFNIKTITVL